MSGNFYVYKLWHWFMVAFGKLLTEKWSNWARPTYVSSLPIRARLADFVTGFTWTLFDVTIETRWALCHAIRSCVKVRKVTAFTRRRSSIAGLAFQSTPLAFFSFSYEKASATRRYTFERHIWTCTLNSGIFCVSAVVKTNSTLKRKQNIVHHHHHHYYPASTARAPILRLELTNQDSEGVKNSTLLK